ncbi:V-set and immunoglobulin domain-containing protein 8 Precursor [Channa argus]|uniref:V-set and immunoglobulin domain-containing protein 8-like n=1 Tax=Channa argus TaxID=215402 RepID=UPI0014175A09|nr:V-set and immunoglobulin domain-containing protein 8 Precursor [Channa argus]
MASSTPGTSVAFFTCLWIFVLAKDQQQITVKPGDDVTLQCLDHRGGDIELLEWTRQDPNENVFVWKHGKMFEDPQHPSFQNRVELRDPEMKDGDVSVILRNSSINDTGTYECRVKNSNKITPPQLITTITMIVTDSGGEGGHTGEGGDDGGRFRLVVALLVCNVLLFIGMICMIYRKCYGHVKKNPDIKAAV